MNRRGKRLTLGVTAMGLAVVLALAIAYRKPILEHVEAWHFQLTRETVTITPDAVSLKQSKDPSHEDVPDKSDILECFARWSGRSIIVDHDAPVRLRWISLVLASAEDPTTDTVVRILRDFGYRILEQRFPRRAYVVMRDQPRDVEPPAYPVQRTVKRKLRQPPPQPETTLRLLKAPTE